MNYKVNYKIMALFVLFVLFFISFVVGGVWFYYEIHTPARLSVVASCDDNAEQVLEKKGYVVSGVTLNEIDEVGEVINITLIYKEGDETAMRHEKCHMNQRLVGCDHRFIKYLQEVQCYILQRF